MFSIILSCVTEVLVRHGRGGGFGNSGVFLAHNYVSEQFGNYVEYGTYYIHHNNRFMSFKTTTEHRDCIFNGHTNM